MDTAMIISYKPPMAVHTTIVYNGPVLENRIKPMHTLHINQATNYYNIIHNIRLHFRSNYFIERRQFIRYTDCVSVNTVRTVRQKQQEQHISNGMIQ